MNTQAVTVQRDETPTSVSPAVDLVAAMRDIFSVEDARLDYGYAKLVLDRLVEPDTATTVIMATLDRMMEDARRLAGPSPTPDVQLAALHRLIYEAGPWNDHRPFAYDHADPLGQRIGNKLLATYLATRRGNCISMPALFLILAERLGLDVTLAKAPLHVFLHYRREDGRVLNLEATSGGHPARDDWYRQQMPMSDRAVASGLYLRSLPKRESVALLATTVLEHLIEQRRFAEALAVSEIILRHAPHDAYTMVKQGSVYGKMIEAEFIRKYRAPALIPGPLRWRYLTLARKNLAVFQAAEALGWEPVA